MDRLIVENQIAIMHCLRALAAVVLGIRTSGGKPSRDLLEDRIAESARHLAALAVVGTDVREPRE